MLEMPVRNHLKTREKRAYSHSFTSSLDSRRSSTANRVLAVWTAVSRVVVRDLRGPLGSDCPPPWRRSRYRRISGERSVRIQKPIQMTD